MEPGDDQNPRRRSSDVWTDERLTDNFKRIDQQLTVLSPLPNAIGKLEVRVDRAVQDVAAIDITAALGRVEDQVASLHGKLDADMEGLKDTYIPRTEMPALYVPRLEHDRRAQIKMQWPGVVLACIQIGVLLMVLLGVGGHH